LDGGGEGDEILPCNVCWTLDPRNLYDRAKNNPLEIRLGRELSAFAFVVVPPTFKPDGSVSIEPTLTPPVKIKSPNFRLKPGKNSIFEPVLTPSPNVIPTVGEASHAGRVQFFRETVTNPANPRVAESSEWLSSTTV